MQSVSAQLHHGVSVCDHCCHSLEPCFCNYSSHTHDVNTKDDEDINDANNAICDNVNRTESKMTINISSSSRTRKSGGFGGGSAGGSVDGSDGGSGKGGDMVVTE